MRRDGPGYILSSWKSSSDSGRYLQNCAAIDIFLQDSFPAFSVLMPWDFQHHVHCYSAWQPWMDFSSINISNHFWNTWHLWHFCILNSFVKASQLFYYVLWEIYPSFHLEVLDASETCCCHYPDWRCKEEKFPQVSSVNQGTHEAAVWGLVAQKKGFCV